MESNQIDNLVDLFKKLSQFPNLTSGRIVSSDKNGITIQSIWSQRNLEKRKKQKYAQDFSFDSNLDPIVESFPVDISSELLTATSENEELKAILREVTVDGKTKQFIEIWDKRHFVKSYDLSAFDCHGDVYTTPTFASFSWSPDNNKLLYIAEKKLPKSEPFYKQKSNSKSDKPDEESSRGTEYIFKPDWGEQLVGKHQSVVVILNIELDTITPIESIPNDYFPGQVIWAPNGNDIVGIAYKLYHRYLGLIYCTNRQSFVFHLQGTDFQKLSGEGLSCRSPRFSPDGKYLVWLEREISVPHHHVHRLAYIKWGVTKTPGILLDVVKTCLTIAKNNKFYGLYNQSLPKRCWSDDSKYIFLSTTQRSSIKSYFINIETKTVNEIINSDNTSLSILDVRKNYVTFSRSTLIQPSQLVIGKFDPNSTDIDNLHLKNCTKVWNSVDNEKIINDTTEFVYDNDDPVKDFNFTYLGVRDAPEKSVPLIAIPHGGPHSTFTNDFNLNHVFLSRIGFGVLRINYRGSVGLGGDNVEYILGKVGQSDVLDCVTAINYALKKYPCLNPNNVSLWGGSHGGFLAAHLSGQHPDMFKAVALRNPVIDVATMFSISDIPDWCPGEAGYSKSTILPETTPSSSYPELIQQMLCHSPILYADKVKAPTLIGLGSNDLRVPQSQGRLWYYRLRENNVKAKLFVYKDNHTLSKDEVEIDFIINIALWMLEHNKK